ncbi:hypothetical protein WJX74_002641 [Apatococcus lobatus]|uniref:C2H2-type domain-containing protein n=2 Tax=Apatococcus TaxID=904362 RepID=A0AAW1RKI7_9CHLO
MAGPLSPNAAVPASLGTCGRWPLAFGEPVVSTTACHEREESAAAGHAAEDPAPTAACQLPRQSRTKDLDLSRADTSKSRETISHPRPTCAFCPVPLQNGRKCKHLPERQHMSAQPQTEAPEPGGMSKAGGTLIKPGDKGSSRIPPPSPAAAVAAADTPAANGKPSPGATDLVLASKGQDAGALDSPAEGQAMTTDAKMEMHADRAAGGSTFQEDWAIEYPSTDMNPVGGRDTGENEADFAALHSMVDGRVEDGMLHLMRASGKDKTGHAIWACPLCPAEPQPRTYQRPSALHGHLEACHSQQLKHVKMAAYLTAFSLVGQHKLVARLSGMRHSTDDNPKPLKFSSQKRKATASPDALVLSDPATEAEDVTAGNALEAAPAAAAAGGIADMHITPPRRGRPSSMNGAAGKRQPGPASNAGDSQKVPLSLGGRSLVEIAAPAPDFVALAPADSLGTNKYKPMFARLLDLTQGQHRDGMLMVLRDSLQVDKGDSRISRWGCPASTCTARRMSTSSLYDHVDRAHSAELVAAACTHLALMAPYITPEGDLVARLSSSNRWGNSEPQPLSHQPSAKQKKQRRQQADADQQPSTEAAEPARSLRRLTSEPAPIEQGALVDPHQAAPKISEASPDILAAQAEMVIYEPAVSSAHLEITTHMLQDPAVQAQHALLVKCCNIQCTGTQLLKLRLPGPNSNLWICDLNGCKADFPYPGQLHGHYQQFHAAELEDIETIAYLIPHVMRSDDKVVALLSHTRGRGVNPKPFEAGAGLPSPQHKSPWALTGARPSKRANTRQSTGTGDDADTEDPSYDGSDHRLRQRPRRAALKPDTARLESLGQQQEDGIHMPNDAAAPESAMPIDAGVEGQHGVDVVPYAAPSTDMALLGNGALEQQVSSEISALMQAALQSGRQVDVELPSGAVMRIR